MLEKILLFTLFTLALTVNNGRGLTPIMGWRPYDHDKCVTD